MVKNCGEVFKLTCHMSNTKFKQLLFTLFIASIIYILFLNPNFLALSGKSFIATLNPHVWHFYNKTVLKESVKNFLPVFQKSTPRWYPLNMTFLNQSIKNFIPILRDHTGRSVLEIEKMMTAQFPEFQYNKIRAHTLSGKNLSITQVHLLIQDDKVVPNAAHFVLPFYKPTLQFHHLVCILSAYWIHKPNRLMLWYNEWPSGEYWDYLLRNITDVESKVIFVHRPVPTQLYTVAMNVKEHQSDAVRMEALLVFGGAYFDLDVVVLKNMDSLRNYSFTIGREHGSGLCNGVMLSAPNSSFLSLWHLGYQVMYDHQWAIHSVHLPNSMQKIWPHHVHVEEESMDRPNWMETAWIYGKKRVWLWKEKNYCMHLWYRFHNVQYNFESIKHVDSMLGDMFRYVLFGTSTK